MTPAHIQAISTAEDRAATSELLIELWGSPIIASHGSIFHPSELPGFVARQDNEIVGLITYAIDDDWCEIVTLNSLREGMGIGSRLIQAVKQTALEADCSRLWLITTNDNLHAMKFYQKRGFRPIAIHPNAVDEARKLKPEIPLIGNDGIPIHDELELEMLLEPSL